MRFVNLAILPCERQEAKIYPAPLSFWIWGAFFIAIFILLILTIYIVLDRRIPIGTFQISAFKYFVYRYLGCKTVILVTKMSLIVV